MKLLRDIADWTRSTAGAIWRMVAPHAGLNIAGGAAADLTRSRRELVVRIPADLGACSGAIWASIPEDLGTNRSEAKRSFRIGAKRRV